MSLYAWEPADHVLTPKERIEAIRQFESEIATFNAFSVWESRYDYDPDSLKRRELLRNLMHAMEDRIAELQHPR